ncbi:MULTISPECIES: inorganic diphosphatase [Methanobacterium]|jgi:inorganic pyrophosphatase|uniref:Inorganic pyrophosphatase n=1 Tax=Methanobacterium subterraneum TaxID=59277 RepID=A0A7K4DPQ9_9EURY|nr:MULTISPECIES: inorganic diphosphatase [Methanobacterium]AUB57881.1 inorganic pyrophosphatase [Methanobacterium sp. MZ-A1]MBW4256469.1 inorganic diphosphatase [Methanobacterium sp. YSL]NMO10451.1 inorganic diphosphatase [Methanobacterium subterraneum]
MNLWKDIKPGPNAPEVVYAVIEIPKGSRNKYEYDKDKEAFIVDRVLSSPFFYPAEYGIIPQTLYDDGDPMDILVLMEQPTFPGCVIESRPIGLLKMLDGEEQDDKVLAVPVDDPKSNHIKNIDDLPESLLNEISHFFQEYKRLEGKSTEILGWEDYKEAFKAIGHSIILYKE